MGVDDVKGINAFGPNPFGGNTNKTEGQKPQLSNRLAELLANRGSEKSLDSQNMLNNALKGNRNSIFGN